MIRKKYFVLKYFLKIRLSLQKIKILLAREIGAISIINKTNFKSFIKTFI